MTPWAIGILIIILGGIFIKEKQKAEEPEPVPVKLRTNDFLFAKIS